ncbi:response regulator [uncultured Fibrella sp.]|uniref:response regulator n=1 Tax=uncultured Fibrella sp. TaxID=1284596 RepID=UPI0035C9A48B
MHDEKDTATAGRPTLILVDDDSDDRLLMKMALRELRLNLSIQEVENGRHLLLYLRADFAAHPNVAFVPWIIVLDKHMPELGGFDTLIAIKADPIFSLVPVVLFINPDDADDRARCEALGATVCVPKPTDFNQMKILMQDIYDLWRATNHA